MSRRCVRVRSPLIGRAAIRGPGGRVLPRHLAPGCTRLQVLCWRRSARERVPRAGRRVDVKSARRRRRRPRVARSRGARASSVASGGACASPPAIGTRCARERSAPTARSDTCATLPPKTCCATHPRALEETVAQLCTARGPPLVAKPKPDDRRTSSSCIVRGAGVRTGSSAAVVQGKALSPLLRVASARSLNRCKDCTPTHRQKRLCDGSGFRGAVNQSRWPTLSLGSVPPPQQCTRACFKAGPLAPWTPFKMLFARTARLHTALMSMRVQSHRVGGCWWTRVCVICDADPQLCSGSL